MYMVLILDSFYKKDCILESYLNAVYLWQDGDEQIQGFSLANLYCCGLPIDKLNLDQYVLIVDMVKSASLYISWRNLKLDLNGRNLVLLNFYHQDVIEKQTYLQLFKRPLKFFILENSNFLQLFQIEVKEKLKNQDKTLSDLRIFTTLENLFHNFFGKTIKVNIPELKKKKKLKDFEIKTIIVDKSIVDINALVSSFYLMLYAYKCVLKVRRFIDFLYKLLIYLKFLFNHKKYHLNIWVSNYPVLINLEDDTYCTPKNNNYQFNKRVFLLDSLTHYINIPIVNFILYKGLDSLIENWIHLDFSKKYLNRLSSISLGSINLTPIKSAQDFQISSNQEYKSFSYLVRFIIFDDKKILYQSLVQSKKTVFSKALYLTVYAMQKFITFRTDKFLDDLFENLSLTRKTGIKNNLVNSWFV
ncbi:hypothetical protein FQV32_01240 [Buchnera aphidicola (Aphis gossypii)]|uniref:Glycosyl transferase family 51 domain-containing protein n=2 Tax=Buchnera aphidicola TaxID=9 RepID=A0A5J6ZES2_9GAMM|nr:hypothetical protein FQV32_01240 [Buchnera aphidicola (Aphis gossypii)]